MINLKYAGLCAAGLAVESACFALDLLIYEIVDRTFGYLPVTAYIIFGAALCIASGFVHVKFMNIIRQKLAMKPTWYLLAVFAAPLALSALAFAVGIVLDLTVWSGRTGFFNYSPSVRIFIGVIPIVVVSSISWVSTLCIDQYFGAAKPENREDGKR